MSGWIPQVYYDFLARVVPGSVVLVGVFYLREGPVRGFNFALRSMSEPEGSLLFRFGVGLLAAYLIGVIIGELGELLAGRLLERRDAGSEAGFARECLDEHNRALAVLGREPVAVLLDDLPDMDVMIEQLTLADPYSGSRLLALLAERRLCLVLAFGLFLLFFVNLFAYMGDFVPKRLVVEGLFLLSLLVFWRRSTRLHERVVRQTCLGWLMRVS
ncbi:MAG: hypothetical protein ABIE42_06010 [Candidatus Eisenbacteria bacterium]